LREKREIERKILKLREKCEIEKNAKLREKVKLIRKCEIERKNVKLREKCEIERKIRN